MSTTQLYSGPIRVWPLLVPGAAMAMLPLLTKNVAMIDLVGSVDPAAIRHAVAEVARVGRVEPVGPGPVDDEERPVADVLAALQPQLLAELVARQVDPLGRRCGRRRDVQVAPHVLRVAHLGH